MKCVNFTSLELSSYSLNGRVLAAFPEEKNMLKNSFILKFKSSHL